MGIKLTENQLEILKKNHDKNINVINFADGYPISRVEFVKDSVILTGKSDNDWTYISLADDGDMEEIITHLRYEDNHVAILDDCMLEYFKDTCDIEWILSCAKMIYRGNTDIAPEEVSELTLEDAKYIQENNVYGDFTDVDYISDRIRKGIGLGIRIDDQLIAWILTHDDGAIGFMKVLKEHRNKGYAMKLSNETIRRLLEKGEIPFVHIEKNNEKSINLAKKAGFEYVGDINWIKLSQKV